MRLFVRLSLIASLIATGSVAEVLPQPVVPAAESKPPRWIKGTEIQLMVIREVNSRTAKPGDRFTLRVNSPVVVNGVTAIPVGASANGEVIAATGTSAAGGKGQVSLRLVSVDTRWGPVVLTGTKGKQGSGNSGGVVLGVLGFGLLGLLNKGGNAVFKGGDIIVAYIDEGEANLSEPMVIPH